MWTMWLILTTKSLGWSIATQLTSKKKTETIEELQVKGRIHRDVAICSRGDLHAVTCKHTCPSEQSYSCIHFEYYMVQGSLWTRSTLRSLNLESVKGILNKELQYYIWTPIYYKFVICSNNNKIENYLFEPCPY
jgi:hypothetical protein